MYQCVQASHFRIISGAQAVEFLHRNHITVCAFCRRSLRRCLRLFRRVFRSLVRDAVFARGLLEVATGPCRRRGPPLYTSQADTPLVSRGAVAASIGACAPSQDLASEPTFKASRISGRPTKHPRPRATEASTSCELAAGIGPAICSGVSSGT